MNMFIFVNYKEEAGQVVEIKACLVEGDHEGPDQVFRGANAVEQLRSWAAPYPYVTGYSTQNFLDPEEMERVRQMLKGHHHEGYEDRQ